MICIYIYIICIYIYIFKTLNEIAKGNFKNTLIQCNIYNVQNVRPHLQSSSVARHRATDEDCRCGRQFRTLYIFHWIKVFLKLPFAISICVLFIAIQYAAFRKLYIYIYKLHSNE